MDNIDKSKLILPFMVSCSAAISVLVMYIRHYDFYRMLWTLLIVMIIFFIIGDIVQYIYMRIRPRVIPEADDIEKLLSKVDTTKLQLDESILQQYLNDDNENDFVEELPESVMREAQRFGVDESEFFGTGDDADYQDETFMDEQSGDF